MKCDIKLAELIRGVIMRYGCVFLFVIVFSLQAQTTGLKEACEYLQSNSQTLITAFENCDSRKMQLVGYDCDTNHIRGKVISLLKNSVRKNTEKEAEEIVKSYLQYLPWISYSLTSSFTISDSISIRFLLELIQAKDTNGVHPVAYNAYRILTENTAIEGLLQNKEALKKVVSTNTFTFQNLLALIAQSKEEKENLLKLNLRSEYKALLGDTVALNAMINKYGEMKYYEEKRIEAEKLVFTQQPEAIKAVIESFNAPFYRVDFEHEPPCTTQTLRSAIMSSFMRYFPNEKLFNIELRNIERKRELLQDSAHTASIINVFGKLIKEKYQIQVPIPQIKYPLGQPCLYFIPDYNRNKWEKIKKGKQK